jgi:Ca-activated chloride channel homolog
MGGDVIEWGTPAAFLFVLPVIALAAQPRLTGRNRLALGDLEGARSGISIRLVAARLVRPAQLVALLLLVVALARPRTTRTDVVVDSDGLDIILSVDTSGSMEERDFSVGLRSVDRLEVAKGVMRDFIEARPHDRIGVVAFGEQAFTFVPLTMDHATLLNVLGGVEIGVAGAQGTAIGSAIAVASKRLKDLDAPSRVVILLTDGRNNAGRISPLEAAQAAAALNIRVYTIGVGARGGALRSLMGDGLDEGSLKELAETTGGRYFRATSTRSLERIYATIDELEPSPAEVRKLVDHQEHFRRFAFPGWLLLVATLLLSSTWLRRLP